MQRLRAYATRAIVMAVWLTLRVPAAIEAQTEIPAEERAVIERRVEDLEETIRQLRDRKLARCRGNWEICSNKRCQRIRITEASRWQLCQDACDTEYERCKTVAYEYWAEGE